MEALMQACIPFDAGSYLVSSLYLTLDRAYDQDQGYLTRLKTMIKQAKDDTRYASLDRAVRLSLDSDWEQMYEAVAGRHGYATRGLALFSCHAKGLWHAVTLPARVDSRLSFDLVPHLGQLIRFHRACGKGMVLMVGRTRARLIQIRSATALNEETWESEVPQRVKEGGWRMYEEKRIDHHILDHLGQHLREAARRAGELMQTAAPEWLIVGGSDEPRSLLQKIMPVQTANVIGYLDLPADTPLDRIIAEANALELGFRERELDGLMARLQQAAPRGGASLGVTDTAAAAHRGALGTLILAPDRHDAGRRCRQCGTLATERYWQGAGRCPTCASPMAEPVGDVLEALVLVALAQQAGVVYAEHGAACWEEAGRVGALLRF